MLIHFEVLTNHSFLVFLLEKYDIQNQKSFYSLSKSLSNLNKSLTWNMSDIRCPCSLTNLLFKYVVWFEGIREWSTVLDTLLNLLKPILCQHWEKKLVSSFNTFFTFVLFSIDLKTACFWEAFYSRTLKALLRLKRRGCFQVIPKCIDKFFCYSFVSRWLVFRQFFQSFQYLLFSNYPFTFLQLLFDFNTI